MTEQQEISATLVPTEDGTHVMRLSAETIDAIMNQETLLTTAPDLRESLESVRVSAELVSHNLGTMQEMMTMMGATMATARMVISDEWLTQAQRSAVRADYQAMRRNEETADMAANELYDQRGAGWVPLASRLRAEHTYTVYKNTHLACKKCFVKVDKWHNPETCSCGMDEWWNEPCGHVSTVHSTCPTFSIGEELRCKCEEMGAGPHDAEDDEDDDGF